MTILVHVFLVSMLVTSFASNVIAQSTPNDTRSAELQAATTAAATERSIVRPETLVR